RAPCALLPRLLKVLLLFHPQPFLLPAKWPLPPLSSALLRQLAPPLGGLSHDHLEGLLRGLLVLRVRFHAIRSSALALRSSRLTLPAISRSLTCSHRHAYRPAPYRQRPRHVPL